MFGEVGCRPQGAGPADDAEDVALLHDHQVLAVDLDLGARPLAEQDPVAGLDVQRRDLPRLRAAPVADGDDFAFLRLFLGGVGNDDPPLGLLLSLDPTARAPACGGPRPLGVDPLSPS